MDERDADEVPHRPLQYHPALAPAKKGVFVADLPLDHVRALDGRARRWRGVFVVMLATLTVVTMGLAAFLALG